MQTPSRSRACAAGLALLQRLLVFSSLPPSLSSDDTRCRPMRRPACCCCSRAPRAHSHLLTLHWVSHQLFGLLLQGERYTGHAAAHCVMLWLFSGATPAAEALRLCVRHVAKRSEFHSRLPDAAPGHGREGDSAGELLSPTVAGVRVEAYQQRPPRRQLRSLAAETTSLFGLCPPLVSLPPPRRPSPACRRHARRARPGADAAADDADRGAYRGEHIVPGAARLRRDRLDRGGGARLVRQRRRGGAAGGGGGGGGAGGRW